MKDTREIAAARAGIFEEVYALQGIGAGFPLEEDLEQERRQARLREDNQ
jgi:hypothetical protein